MDIKKQSTYKLELNEEDFKELCVLVEQATNNIQEKELPHRKLRLFISPPIEINEATPKDIILDQTNIDKFSVQLRKILYET